VFALSREVRNASPNNGIEIDLLFAIRVDSWKILRFLYSRSSATADIFGFHYSITFSVPYRSRLVNTHVKLLKLDRELKVRDKRNVHTELTVLCTLRQYFSHLRHFDKKRQVRASRDRICRTSRICVSFLYYLYSSDESAKGELIKGKGTSTPRDVFRTPVSLDLSVVEFGGSTPTCRPIFNTIKKAMLRCFFFFLQTPRSPKVRAHSQSRTNGNLTFFNYRNLRLVCYSNITLRIFFDNEYLHRFRILIPVPAVPCPINASVYLHISVCMLPTTRIPVNAFNSNSLE